MELERFVEILDALQFNRFNLTALKVSGKEIKTRIEQELTTRMTVCGNNEDLKEEKQSLESAKNEIS
jgi:hypothetical protein